MKKIVIAVAAVLVLVIAAALIVPSFIDWSKYTGEITAQVEKLTGRKVVIGGPVKVQIIPRPVLAVADVHLANLPGAKDPDMASLKSLEVRIALAPLLTGKVRVETIKLVKPVILLERLADGRVNWDFSPPAAAPGAAPSGQADNGKPAQPGQPPAAPAAPAAAPAAAPPIAIDSFTLEGGRVVYRDALRGREETISDIDARVAAASLTGPIESAGSLTVHGQKLSYSVNVAELIQGRTIPLTFNVALGDTSLKIDGSVGNFPEKPRLRAKLTGGGPNLGGAIAALAGPQAAPANLALPFAVTGNVEADVDGGRIEGMEIRLNDQVVKVNAQAALGDKLVASMAVKASWLDLDAALAPAAAPAPAKTEKTDKKDAVKASPATAPASAPAAVSAEPFSLPKDLQAGLTVQVESIVYQGKPISNFTLNADLANGELTLSQLSAQLPGGADVAMFGFLTGRDGKPRFEGEVETHAADLGPLVSWLAPGTQVPPAALKDFAFKTPLVADANYLQLTGINAVAGGAHLTGAVTLALQARPSFGANLAVDKINLDSFLPAPAAAKKGMAPATDAKAAPSSGGGDTGSGPSASGSAPAKSANPLSALKALGGFDANLKLAVGAATLHGLTAKNLAVDATLQRGTLTLRKLNLGDFAGLTAGVTGVLADLDGIPSAKGLALAASAKDLGPLSKALNLPLPLPAASLGKVTLNAKVNGGLLSPAVDADIGALGGTASAKGTLPVLALLGGDIKLKTTVSHPDLAGLLHKLGVAYQPQGRIGGLDLAADVTGNAKALRIDNLKGTVGTIKTTGAVTAALDGAVPRIGADLALGAVTLDPFLPAKQSGALEPAGWGAGPVPVFWAGPGGNALTVRAAAVSSRWSRKAMDLSVLNSLAAAVNLTSPAVTYQGTKVENLDLGATLGSGTAKIDRLKGRVFGGSLDAKGSLTAAGALALNGTLAGLDLSKAGSVTGGAASGGQANGSFNLTAQGRSEADLISSLAGTLAFAGKDIAVEALSSGKSGFGLGGMVMALNQLGGALGGARKGEGLADVDAAFSVAGGVATAQKLQAVTNVGTATGGGTVNLPAWTLDLKGAIQPSQNLLTVLLRNSAKKSVTVPFAVSGQIDAPRVNIDTASLGAGGIAIPGVEKLLKKKGVGDVLQGILGGGQTQQQAPQQQQQPTAPTQQQQQQQKVTPQDLLKGLLKKF